MNFPQPPLDNSPESLQKGIKDIMNFLMTIHNNGSKQKGFTQGEIDKMTDLSQLQTTVFNTTTNESNVSYLDSGIVKWRAY